jgi:methyltransferase-like protein/cyclopropane fatty-acyl-phospholipid synthase-like methyltransferase
VSGGPGSDLADLARAREEEQRVRDYYDRVPYPSASYRHTHPDHLATLALLHGLEPAHPGGCRVLELGCADGGNLIPMACELPGSRFVGIDLSPGQIASGRASARELGLANVELLTASLLDFDPDLGRFDYILCHGVYSWVAPAVREKILSICRDHLAAHGVAYVSYNTFPGWHLRQVVRDMTLYHTRGIAEPAERAARALDLVAFLAESAWGKEGDPHTEFLRSTREHFEEYRERPSYLLHEYLEETNCPLYFHEFMAQAASHGLQYLADAQPHLTGAGSLPPGVGERLRGFSADRIELEQYADFVLNRSFRRTLLCHAAARIADDPPPERIVERLARLAAASGAKPAAAAPDLRPGVSEAFSTEKGNRFSSSHPLAKAALLTLAAAWPRALAFAALGAEVRARLAGADGRGGGSASSGEPDPGPDGRPEAPGEAGGRPDGREALADLLCSLHASGVIELYLLPPACTRAAGERPRASALARHQAARGSRVTSQHRRVVELDDPVVRFLIRHLDGSRDRAALLRLLAREVEEGRLTIARDGAGADDPKRPAADLAALLDHDLEKMAALALLVE